MILRVASMRNSRDSVKTRTAMKIKTNPNSHLKKLSIFVQKLLLALSLFTWPWMREEEPVATLAVDFLNCE